MNVHFLSLSNTNQHALYSCSILKYEFISNTITLLIDVMKVRYCQNSNSTISAIQLSLRLDYILTCDPPHHPPHHKLNLYTQNWEELTTAQLASRGLSVQLYSHRPVQTLQMFLKLNIIIASQKLIKKKWFSHHRN